MAQGIYKNGEAIEVTYQATKAQTGLDDVSMEVYDEAHLLDVAKHSTMSEIASTGRYYGAFTPDAEGEWSVQIDSATKAGKVTKQFSVTAHNVDAVGDAVAVADGKVDAVDGKVDAVDGKVSAIRGADDDTLKTLSDQIDNVASADSAPMIG